MSRPIRASFSLSRGLARISVVVFSTIHVAHPVTATVILSDNFTGGSTVNSASPVAPTSTSTSYQTISSKSWAPTPTITATPSLKFGIASTTGGTIESQALFTNSPVTLVNAGDNIEMILTFTDTNALLTQSMLTGWGMYNSGGSAPIAGGLNGTATNATTNHTTDGVVGWKGYVSQIAFTGTNSRIMTRGAQTGMLDDRVQDLVTSGSGSQSYASPGATTVGSTSSTASVTLTQGNQYTLDLLFTLNALNGLDISSNLYSGNAVAGSPISTLAATAASPLTTTFDALAFGWRATAASTGGSVIDVNSVTVQSNAVAVPEPASWVLLMCGAAGLGLAAVRRHNRCHADAC